MTKENQESFYQAVGRALTIARERANMTITQLATRSGEQHKTIRGIEAGRSFSAHQTVWMKSVLGLDVYEVMKKSEGVKDVKEVKQKAVAKKVESISDLI